MRGMSLMAARNGVGLPLRHCYVFVTVCVSVLDGNLWPIWRKSLAPMLRRPMNAGI